jgi:hypothetical protein
MEIASDLMEAIKKAIKRDMLGMELEHHRFKIEKMIEDFMESSNLVEFISDLRSVDAFFSYLKKELLEVKNKKEVKINGGRKETW